jgi:hypothetical protein
MWRKAFAVVVLVLLGTILGGGALGKDKEPKKPALGPTPIVHAVIFHLKKDAPKGEASLLVGDAQRMLGRIKTVRGIWAGQPIDLGRGKSGKKFDVGLVVLFKDLRGLKAYLDDPLHKAFAKKHRKFVDEEKLDVFNFLSPVMQARISFQ